MLDGAAAGVLEEVVVDEGGEVDQMSTSFDCDAAGGCEEETASRSVCTGVRCLALIEVVDALAASASACPTASAPLSSNNPAVAPVAPFSPPPVAPLASTAMSFPLKSSRMFRKTCASYAGAGKIELCLRLTRFASDPGVAIPLSDIELREDPCALCAASCSSGVRSLCWPEEEERRLGKQHGKTMLRKRSIAPAMRAGVTVVVEGGVGSCSARECVSRRLLRVAAIRWSYWD